MVAVARRDQPAPRRGVGVLATLAFTGIRTGEVVNLRPQDVDLQGNWLSVTSREDWQSKTRVSRRIPIHPRLKPYLVAALKVSFGKPLLFCGPLTLTKPRACKRVSQDKLLIKLQSIAKSIALPTGHANHGFVAHSTRHFFRTHCTNHRVPERAIDVWMGHTGQATTGALYYQLAPDESQSLMTQVPFDAQIGVNKKGKTDAA